MEDDDDVRDALAQMLEDCGYRVATAAHGREALERIRSRPTPFVVLLDLRMPEMSGWAFRQEQLEDPAIATIPIVVLSAERELAEEAKKLKASAFLDKPVDVKKLLTILRRIKQTTLEVPGRGESAAQGTEAEDQEDSADSNG